MNNRKNIRYLLLIILLLFISIGYSYLNSTLNITGLSTINNPTWDIHWENVSVENGSISASTPIIDTSKTTVNYSITLTNPGDYYEFTVDAVNAGTIDGMVSVVSNKLNGTEITTLPNYLEYKVSYEDNIDIAPNQLLAANSSEKYKVHIGYKKDLTASDLPSTTQTLNLSFSVTYVQSDTNGAPVPHPQTVYTANIVDGNDDGTIYIGQAIPNSITTYQTPEQAMSSLKEKLNGLDAPFFFRHTLSNNIVTDSYVGFIVTPEMIQENPGMTAGTYYLKAKKTEEEIENITHCMSEYDDGNGNCIDPEFNTNKETLLRAFGSSYCTDYFYYFFCNTPDFYAEITQSGSVHAVYGNHCWNIDNQGKSSCGRLA